MHIAEICSCFYEFYPQWKTLLSQVGHFLKGNTLYGNTYPNAFGDNIPLKFSLTSMNVHLDNDLI